MEYRGGGQYEIDLDFIEIPLPAGANVFPPDCTTTTYSKVASWGQVVQFPPSNGFNIGWEVDFGLVGTKLTGTGDIPAITIDSNTVQGWDTSSTTRGCPILVIGRYLCPNAEITNADFVTDGIARNDFIQIATLTKNPIQKSIIDGLKLLAGYPVDYPITDFGLLYDKVQAYLLANQDVIFDLSNLKLVTLDLVDTLTNLKKLNLSHNNLGWYELYKLDRLALTYIDLSYNWLFEDAKSLMPMRASLKYIDISHNYLQQCYVYYNNGSDPIFDVDYFDCSYNTIAIGDWNRMRAKVFKFTNNVFPDHPFFTVVYQFKNGAINPAQFGVATNFTNSELIDLSNTALIGSYNNVLEDPTLPSPDKAIKDLIAILVTAGHTLSEAQAIIVRDPKWESQLEHTMYVPDPIISGNGQTLGDESLLIFGYPVVPNQGAIVGQTLGS